ncbi:ribosomal protein uL16 3-hydroxylase [Acinetobacter sp. WZC-1]|uniref:ribosomal protein uL16 3-hydroxylase n=1 Tax=Acinetobacter sp. WZC-1 TaxID=3459034 RepID=UPI00403D8C92
MSFFSDIPGAITEQQFLSEYWQQKPLLIRNALPELADLLEPADIMALALEENVTARLIRQKDKNPDMWSVKPSPLLKGDFQKLPKQWTLMVQAVDHYSLELAELWEKFSFIPQWRRDDIMVSHAPKGGSVGKHFDFYDVFLVQGYGHRRWQLGQKCDASTTFIAGQPLKLLPEMDVYFDEVLAPGDLLYVPPGLSHYGIAEDDCLTYSFGFRMPGIADLMDRISDQFAGHALFRNPLMDIQRQAPTSVGQITNAERNYLKAELLHALEHSALLDDAIMSLITEPNYPDNIPEADEITATELETVLEQGYLLRMEPASRLIYTEQDNVSEFWANAEKLEISETFVPWLKQLADGQTLQLNADLAGQHQLEDIAALISTSILMLVPDEQ